MRRCACALAGLLAAGSAFAAEKHAGHGHGAYPHADFDLELELQSDRTYRSGDPGAKRTVTFAKTELEAALFLNRALHFEVGLAFEPVNEPTAGRDSWFGEQGAFVETLAASYDDGRWLATAGKFTQNFGIAWELAPGIYGDEFPEDYKLTERWGARAGFRADAGDWGEHVFSAAAFFRDTTALSDSAFTRRGRLRRADGGPANTGDPRSFNLALDSDEFVVAPGLRTHLGLVRQARGTGNDAAETGVAAGVAYDLELAEDWAVTPLIEYVRFRNAGGADGARARYLTGGVELRHRGWNVAVVQAFRTTREPAADELRDRLFQISVGYAFNIGLGLDLGWFATREGGIDSRGVGGRLSYMREF